MKNVMIGLGACILVAAWVCLLGFVTLFYTPNLSFLEENPHTFNISNLFNVGIKSSIHILLAITAILVGVLVVKVLLLIGGWTRNKFNERYKNTE